jgi:hypothetical protein
MAKISTYPAPVTLPPGTIIPGSVGSAPGDTKGITLAKIRSGFVVVDAVLQFGAKGDGTTDDTAAIQAAIDWAYAQVSGYTYGFANGEYKAMIGVYLPAGTYLITSAIQVKAGVRLYGDGVVKNGIGSVGSFTYGIDVRPFGELHSIGYDGNGRQGISVGDANAGAGCKVCRVRIWSVGVVDAFPDRHCALRLQGFNVDVQDCWTWGGYSGVRVSDCSDIRCNNLIIVDAWRGIELVNVSHARFQNFVIDTARDIGVVLDMVRDVLVDGSVWHNDAVDANTPSTACVVGTFYGGFQNHSIDARLSVVNAGANALSLNYCDDSRFSFIVANGTLFTGDTHPCTNVVAYGSSLSSIHVDAALPNNWGGGGETLSTGTQVGTLTSRSGSETKINGNHVVTAPGTTGSTTTAAGTVAVVINGTTYHLLRASGP